MGGMVFPGGVVAVKFAKYSSGSWWTMKILYSSVVYLPAIKPNCILSVLKKFPTLFSINSLQGFYKHVPPTFNVPQYEFSVWVACQRISFPFLDIRHYAALTPLLWYLIIFHGSPLSPQHCMPQSSTSYQLPSTYPYPMALGLNSKRRPCLTRWYPESGWNHFSWLSCLYWILDQCSFYLGCPNCLKFLTEPFFSCLSTTRIEGWPYSYSAQTKKHLYISIFSF